MLCYLASNFADKGLLVIPLKPIPLQDIQFLTDVFVDVAFACEWGTEQGTTNPDSVKSRAG